MVIVSDRVGNQSDAVKRFGNNREIASSKEARLTQFLKDHPAEGPEENEPRTQEDLNKQGKDFIDHIAEIPPAIGTGLLKSVQELGNFAIDAADWVENFAASKGLGDGDAITDEDRMSWANDPSTVFQPQTFTGHLVSGISQFLAPAGLLGKVTKGVKITSALGKFAKAGAIGAAVDFALFDPNEERLSNLLQTFPSIRNPVSAYLASNPKDTRAEGRLKNALEGMGIGIMAEGLLRGLKAVRQQRVGNSILKDAEKVFARAEKKGVEIPIEEGVDLTKFDEVKAEVKAERPTQVEPEAVPEIPDDLVIIKDTTPEEAAEVLRGFEDVTPEGKAININLDKIETPDDVKKAIKTISDTFPEEIEEARRGIITEERTSQLADDLGMDVEDLLSRQEGEAFNAENIEGARRILNVSAERVAKLAKDINSGNDSKQTMAQFIQIIDQHRVIQAQISGIAAEAGRALRAFQMGVGLDGATRNRFLDDIIRHHGGDSGIKQIAEAIAEAGGSTSAISKLARKSTTRKLLDVAKETWINGLLSGPKTHVINAFSNFTTLATSLPERFLAEKFANGSIDSVAKGESAAMISGMSGGITDAMRMAKETFKTGKSVFRTRKIDLPFEKSLSARAFGQSQDTIMGRFLDFMGKGVNLPVRFLESSDEFFKSMNYRMEVHAQAHRKAIRMKVAKNLTDEQTAKLTKKFIENPADDIVTAAEHSARENTFTKPLGELSLRGFDPQKLDDLVRSTPVMRVVAPFTKTGLNLVEYALNRTPFAKGLLDDVKAGGLRKDTALSRVAFGMATMSTAAGLTATGRLTGRGPVDVGARRALEATGWKPYSIRVGDSYVGYDRFDPFGSLLGIAADTTEILGTLSRDRDNEGQQLAIQAGSVVASFFTPEFVVRNINDFLDAISGDERKLENFLSNVARGVVPFSSFARSIRKTVDPIVRDTRGDPEAAFPMFDRILNEIRNTIPFMSDSLPPKRNIFGEVRTFLPFVNDPDELGAIDNQGKDAISKEIQRLNMTGPSLINNDPKLEFLKIDMPQKFIKKTFGGLSVSVKLNAEEYDKLVQLSAGIGLTNSPFPGQTLREVLNAEVSNDYPLLGDSPRTDESKRLLIKEIVSAFRKGAREEFITESADIEDKFIERFEEKASRVTGERVNLRL